MRATTFSLDNLEGQVLRDGDFFQLHVEAAGGKVEWWKDGELLPNMEKGLSDRACRYVNVDQPNRTQLLEPGTYKRREEDFPPNAGRHSYLGGRCQVCHTHIHLFFWKFRKILTWTLSVSSKAFVRSAHDSFSLSIKKSNFNCGCCNTAL